MMIAQGKSIQQLEESVTTSVRRIKSEWRQVGLGLAKSVIGGSIRP